MDHQKIKLWNLNRIAKDEIQDEMEQINRHIRLLSMHLTPEMFLDLCLGGRMYI